MNLLRDVAPDLHREITTLLESLADLLVQTDFGVTDLHADNIGRADDGRLVVRDFGMNTLSVEMIARAVRQIQELPEPTAVLAA
jgi:predicted unusual protein kinase regulating ubiquinone biosynthesis (AarF/ABC1/UbiB family)